MLVHTDKCHIILSRLSYPAISNANAGDTIYISKGTFNGSGDAVITVTKSITIFGGWNGASNGSVIRDPTVYTSTLDGQNA